MLQNGVLMSNNIAETVTTESRICQRGKIYLFAGQLGDEEALGCPSLIHNRLMFSFLRARPEGLVLNIEC
jgi:hypothetical protein